jgi:hypothetical protein
MVVVEVGCTAIFDFGKEFSFRPDIIDGPAQGNLVEQAISPVNVVGLHASGGAADPVTSGVISSNMFWQYIQDKNLNFEKPENSSETCEHSGFRQLTSLFLKYLGVL